MRTIVALHHEKTDWVKLRQKNYQKVIGLLRDAVTQEEIVNNIANIIKTSLDKYCVRKVNRFSYQKKPANYLS